MDSDSFYKDRDDRTHRYGERRLDPSRPILITADPAYLTRLDGQIAAITLANLLGRMSPHVALGFEDHPLHAALPIRASSLVGFILANLKGADPFGTFEHRAEAVGDYRIHLGSSGHDWVVHGSGWNAYVGPSPSPLEEGPSDNPLGSAFAAVMAGALIFKPQFPDRIERPHVVDVFRWEPAAGPSVPLVRPSTLGEVWIVGAGSVGSAAAYFLALSGFRFRPSLIDMDMVKVHNLDRSPIFLFEDRLKPKVDAVARFLASFGIDAVSEVSTLRKSAFWQGRQAGRPDILIPAANEDDVRYDIEQGYPPVQVFGTTGKSWQAAVFRLVPPLDPCTCCIFPPEKPADTTCATEGNVETADGESEDRTDAALPFLSFVAGLMTVIEIAKLAMPVETNVGNRAFFQPLSDDVVLAIPAVRREDCICSSRHLTVHREMILGSRYGGLSRF